MTDAADRLIVALDLPTTDEATALVEALGPSGCFYKIGYQLIPIGGLSLATKLSEAGKKVFLDFKFHDIGATVERGVKSIATLGADFLTVHAEKDVVAAAVAGRGDDPRLKILAVTVLTSLDQSALAANGIDMPLGDLVMRRAEIAVTAGVDGLVCSAHEAPRLRDAFGQDIALVTPGVRPAGAAADDQARVATPAIARQNGADFVVVGRPITRADDPAGVANAIIADLS
ncbi:MAG: orotidine-5'-phosphate decarboxylase [Pseudomonadota bacterium]